MSIRDASLVHSFCAFFDGINSLRGCDKNGDGYDLELKPLENREYLARDSPQVLAQDRSEIICRCQRGITLVMPPFLFRIT